MRRFVLPLLALSTVSALADEEIGRAGLAEKYAADAGIGKDPAVLFHESFENKTLGDLKRDWSDISNEDGEVLAFSPDNPELSKGKQSLQMTSTLGRNTGGHLYRKLPREVDKVYARFYVKFAAEAQHVHHFVHLGGYRPATLYPQGGAGERPRGDERFSVGIEPYGSRGTYPPPGAWNFYAYWPEMKPSAGNKYWGASIPAPKPALVPRERWQCVEVMLKCNSRTESRDGELALWTDGQLAMHIKPGTPRGPWTGLGFQPLESGGEPFEGFRWRLHSDLKINFFWLLFYVTENAAKQNRQENSNPVNRVWFDDIVVATEYVGPIGK